MVNSTADFLRGVRFFLLGIRLILKPNLRRYLIVPIIMNAIILVTTFSLLGYYLYHYIQPFSADFPQWLILILGWLFWLLYGLISLLAGTLIFTLLANLIASPFYGFLAEAVTNLLNIEQIDQTDGTGRGPVTLHSVKNIRSVNATASPSLWLLIPHAIGRELRKLWYFLPWLALCLICLIFPFTWPLFPFLWWGVLTWILGIEFTDYQADNQAIPFKQSLALLKENAFTVFGFGAMVSLAMLAPVANLFVPAAAVAGGTALWLSIQPSIQSQYRLNFPYERK